MKAPRSPSPGPKAEFPAPDRYTVSGLVLGDLCFACDCRVVFIDGGEGMVFAWCECGWPEDAHEMEVL